MSRETLEDPVDTQSPAEGQDDGADDRRRVEDDDEIDSELVAKLIDGLNSL
jgi:hypothetical protein